MVCIGTVVKPHGLQGEFSVDCRADAPFFFDRIKILLMGKGPEKLRPYAVKRARLHKGRPMFTVAGVADRDGAEALRGMEVHVSREELPDIEPDEVYLFEVESLEVLVAGPDGPTPLGRVVEVLNPTVEQEIWVIHTPDGKEVLFPAEDQFVVEVDPDAGRAVIDPPPGLLDLYLAE